jgi:hypothetical protein
LQSAAKKDKRDLLRFVGYEGMLAAEWIRAVFQFKPFEAEDR